ncbi:FAD-binding protein [Cohnella sp. CFH 77786]|uniref:GMC oxidoreductase n=1 Tax=Cohnella sp. CFH 77786 TaxID=2662265 RepID=UPI001C60F774|nr:GMC oxidoreductase [Cohnella sp. CFH 77786]MBW5445139.1 FAD-binding protein [Cohnella sp. CFH 77786]
MLHQPPQTPGPLPVCPSGPVPTLSNWIPLASLEQMSHNEYDVLIVGSGAGGGAVLWRLCEQWKRQRKRIGIIDRGNLELQMHARNLPTMNQERLVAYFNYLSRLLPGGSPEYPNARQLFALGGRTLFWYAFTPRMHEWDLAKWPVPMKVLESYYGIAEQVMNVTREFAKGSSFTEILLERLWMRGYSKASPLPVAADIEPQSFGRIHTDMFTSSISLMARALNERPFDLAVNARAVQILHDNGRVTGVKVMSPDKKAHILRAKTVVVSASTFETPRLLLCSGIQNRALGHYLTNQTFLQATGRISTLGFPVPLGPLNIMVPQTPDRPYSVLLTGPEAFYWYPVAQERPLQEEIDATLYGYGKLETRYENRIELDYGKLDEYGIPEVKVHFSLSPADWNVVGRMSQGVRRIAADAGIRLAPRNNRPPICLTPFGDLHHDAGTCRIGDDPATSAADRYGRVRGTSGLFVADNSALPDTGAENHTLTTVALAIRTADIIARL